MESFALYIHLPFCKRKCPYCGFASSEIGDAEEARPVLDAILVEAKNRSGEETWNGRIVRSLYLGGGTPSILRGSQIRDLVKGLDELMPFMPDAEITIEVNPGTLDDEKVSGWIDAGINRVSLGVQSLDEEVLRRLDRIHDIGEAREAYRLVRAAGFARVGIDLIYGVEVDDALRRWEETLAEAIDWLPEHLSAYGLTIEEGTRFASRSVNGMKLTAGEEIELAQYELAMKMLDEAGYEHYEVSNWSRDQVMRCRHNLAYWDGSDYLAIGPSGHSHDSARGRRFWNHRDTGKWLAAVEAKGTGEEGGELLTPVQRFEERLVLGLRMVEGALEEELREAAENAGLAWPPEPLKGLIELGLLERERGILRYTLKGLVVADEIEVRLSA